ncbi:RNA-directed DNA polymerase, eukaryota, reverse transcriptase zinc-binding domain protein [Tanacetum coccineum]
MVVQKWCIDMCLDKAEPKKIPVWVKMINVPMEAWSVKGISALASSIGKPAIMDETTTEMCVTGVGRMGYARVLVEVDAEKCIKDKIEVMYRSKNVAEDNNCKDKRKNVVDNSLEKNNVNEFTVIQNRKKGREGFKMNKSANIQNGMYDKKRNEGRHTNVNNKWKQNYGMEYRKRRGDEGKGNGEEINKGKKADVNGINTNKEQASGERMGKKDKGKINQEGLTSVGKKDKGKANQEGSNKDLIPNEEQRKIVDAVLHNKCDVNNMEMNGWSEEMKRYYRDKKELFDAAKEMEKMKIQGIFLMVETIDKKSKFFCTVFYASNSGMERRKLWKDLEIQKRITLRTPWVILGDFNVTLKVFEHSNGNANPSREMTEFQDCVNGIEVVDLHSEGFLYMDKKFEKPKVHNHKEIG